MNTTRWFAVFGLLVPLTLLTACGSSGKAPASSGSNSTITEMDYWTSPPPLDPETISAMFKAYHRVHPSITVVGVTKPSAEYIPQVLTEITSHSLPDLLMLDNPDVQEIASTGALEPLSQLGHIDRGAFIASTLKEGEVNGTLYGLPVGNNATVLFYNKSMFRAAGITTPPTTWNQLALDAKKLTHGNTYGFALPETDNASSFTEPFIWGNGGHLRKPTSAADKEALNFLVSLVKNHESPIGEVNWNANTILPQFEEGRIAMMENGPYAVPVIKSQAPNLNYGMAVLPAPHKGGHARPSLGGEVFVIPKTNRASEERAFSLLKFMYDNKTETGFFDARLGYTPALKAATPYVLKEDPYLKTTLEEIPFARTRTQYVGSNYPKIAVIWTTLIQSVLSGRSSVNAATSTAQHAIDQLQNN